MKIPKKVKIGAHYYTIKFRDDLDDENFGVCRPSKLTIFIHSTTQQSQQEETFLHEVLHAIFSQNGLSNVWDPKKEEKDVQILGHAIYQFLLENKLLK